MRTSGYFMMDDEFSVWTFTVWPASCPRPAAGVHVPVHAHVALRTTAHVDLAAAAWWDSDSDPEYTGFPDRHILWYGLPIYRQYDGLETRVLGYPAHSRDSSVET